MAKVAGYNADVFTTGTSTAMTDEACTEVSGTVFQITSTARRILDHEVAVVVKANTVVQSGNYTIDWNFGIITFTDGTHTGETITVTANYLPRHRVAELRVVSYSMSWDTGDSTAMGNAGQDLTLLIQRFTASIEAIQLLDVVYDGGTQTLDKAFDAGEVVVLEIQPTGASGNVKRARGLWNAADVGNNGAAGLAGANMQFQGASRGKTLVSVGPV